MQGKKLFRSRKERMLCGVCGGLAEYFNVDPTLIRLLWVVLLFVTCTTAGIGYIIAAIIMPEEANC